MPGDYTRLTFEAIKNHAQVFMQQGRVLLDSDFNEWVEILSRRIQASDLDTLGPCVVPRETPDGFRIQIVGDSLSIGPGRIYVDGLLAENHGADPREFYRRLEEERGTSAVPYEDQPYLHDVANLFPLPDGGGPHLVYVDVWQREVTHAEDPGLVEKAVGFDTATRLQTVWQVKVLADVGDGVTCATADDEIEGWADLTAPSGGRLTTSAVGVPADTNPCVVNPTGGFRGTENRLYRVEVHDPGDIGTATFKWSRDNGSIATVVTAINTAGDELTVTRTSRDDVLRFSDNDWIEVLDDRLELAGLPGIMARIERVDDVAGTVTLEAALPTDFDFADPRARNTRIRKWDQAGVVLDDSNAIVADVDASGGVIPISGPARFVLEHGVLVEFTLPQGEFRTGDHWVFAARTVDASVEELDAAPPRGIHHHYCKLAVVTFPDVVNDCRVLWPPDFGRGNCGCTECVTAESHNSGAFTIQMALDRVADGGGTVCLGPGTYNLGSTPLRISGAQSVKLVGHGLRTLLLFASTEASEPAVSVNGSIDVTLRSLGVLSVGIADRAGPSMLLQNSALIRVEECGVLQIGLEAGQDAAIALSGFLLGCVIRDNLVWGPTGIEALGAEAFDADSLAAVAGRGYVATFGLTIEDNLLFATGRGVSLDGVVLHLADTRIAGNSIASGPQGAVVSRGFVLPTARLDIAANEIVTSGNGVVVGSSNTRVERNDISSNSDTPAEEGTFSGILLEQGLVPLDLERCHLVGNRIVDVPGDGITVRAPLESAAIRENWIEGVAGNGIAMVGEATARVLTVAANHIIDASTVNEEDTAVSAIRVARADQVDVSNNVVSGFGELAVVSRSVTGIQVVSCGSIRIDGNDVQRVGPPGGFVGFGAGIAVTSPFDRLDVVDNSVRRAVSPGAAIPNARWIALSVAVPRFVVDAFDTFVFEAVFTPPESELATETGPTGVFTPSEPGASVFATAPIFAANFLEINSAEINADLGEFVIVTDGDVIELPRGRQIVAARGNLLEAQGNRPAADVTAGGVCVFSDNRCLLSPAPNSAPPIVDIDTIGTIVSANFLERPASSEASPALDINVGTGPVTILGNIVTGSTLLNGAPLPSGSPWIPINVEV